MLQTTDSENQFVVDILIDLRDKKFSLSAWMHFLGSSWKRSCAIAKANPALKHSWVHTTIFIGAFALAIQIVNFIFEGPVATLRLMPGFLFFVSWQQSDLYWHLGLNRQGRTGTLLHAIGAATTLTLLRGLGASYLLGRFIGGINTPSWLLLLVFLSGIITDILDGQIARRTQTQTIYGQIADGEADFCLHLAIAMILIQENILPLWFGLFRTFALHDPAFCRHRQLFSLCSSCTIRLDHVGKSGRIGIVLLLSSFAFAWSIDHSYQVLQFVLYQLWLYYY